MQQYQSIRRCVFIRISSANLTCSCSPFINQQHAWVHGCDHYPVEVVLEGQRYNAPRTQPSLASFYFWENGTRTKFFEYGITYGASVDEWGFDLRRIVGRKIPASVYPLVQEVSYDFVGNTISGSCVANGAGTVDSMDSEVTTPCLEGTVDLGNVLSYSLTDTRVNTTYNLRAGSKEWYFRDDAPSVRLHRVHADDETLGQTVLTTLVTKPGDCNLLKVCSGVESGVDMIGPIGILLLKLDEYGIRCTERGTGL
jgi:hypothetical protein